MLDELWRADQAARPPAEFRPGNLEAKFVAPPFTVLDTRQGYWQDRRRAWLSLGIKSELGRGADLLSLSPAEGARARWSEALPSSTSKGQSMADQYANSMRGAGAVAQQGGGGRDLAGPMRARMAGTPEAPPDEVPEGGTSIFDPVLCELMYRWFAPEGGAILDPFAGGSVRGIVAAKLGHPYTGIDLSGAQLEANRGQAAVILGPSEPVPQWLHGDSVHLEALLPAGELYDMVLTCPPYFDLEVYSDDPADLSNAEDYATFLEGYGEVITRAAARLRPERFMVLVVSEVRDPAGYCRGLVPDTITAARAAGLHLYNEAVLINSAGSLPLRVTKYMEASRKLGRAHQNVLCFLRGAPPRGWSYDRAAPPSPQLSLALDPAPEPEPPTIAVAYVPTQCEDHESGYHGTQAEADECSAETYGEVGWEGEPEPPAPAPGPAATEEPIAAPVGPEPAPEDPGASWASEPEPEPEPPAPAKAVAWPSAWRPTDDGREVDTTTGEVRDVPAITAWHAEREQVWRPTDPNRRCWQCGAPPSGSFADGSPRYDHSHAAPDVARGQVSMFEEG